MDNEQRRILHHGSKELDLHLYERDKFLKNV